MRTVVLTNSALRWGALPSIASIAISGMILVRAAEVSSDARSQDFFIYITILTFCCLVAIGIWNIGFSTVAATFQADHTGIRFHSVFFGLRHIPWGEISQVTDTSLTTKDHFGKLKFETVRGETIVFVYSALSWDPEVKRGFLQDLSEKLPISIPVSSENSSLAGIRRSPTTDEAPRLSTRALVFRGHARGASAERWTGVFAGVFANVVLGAKVLLDWNVGSLLNPSSWNAVETPVVLAAGVIVLVIAPAFNASTIWGLLSREQDTRLFVSARRIARIAPRGTEVLDAPITRIQALPLSVVASDGRRIRLALGLGIKPGLSDLRTMMGMLNLSSEAKNDLARYVRLAHHPHWTYLVGANCLPVGIYLGAVSLYFESRLAALVAITTLLGGMVYVAQRIYRYYEIGRTTHARAF